MRLHRLIRFGDTTLRACPISQSRKSEGPPFSECSFRRRVRSSNRHRNRRATEWGPPWSSTDSSIVPVSTRAAALTMISPIILRPIVRYSAPRVCHHLITVPASIYATLQIVQVNSASRRQATEARSTKQALPWHRSQTCIQRSRHPRARPIAGSLPIQTPL